MLSTQIGPASGTPGWFFALVDVFNETPDRRLSACCDFCVTGRVMFAAIRIFEEQNVTRHPDGVFIRTDRGLGTPRYWVRVQDIFARDVLVEHPMIDNRHWILSVDNRAVYPEVL